MSIEAGRLRHRVLFEEERPAVDTDGDVVQDATTGAVSRSWQAVGSEDWAAIEPLSAREFIAAQATQSKATARITVRYRSGVTAAMRIVHMVDGQRGTIYNIEGILPDKDSGTEHLTIPVSSGVSATGQ